MRGLLKRIFGGNDAAVESEQEVDIDDYYQRLTSWELDDLEGKWITLVFRDGELKGKIMPASVKRADGYSFVTRLSKDVIAQLWRFWPGNWEQTEMFGGAGIYRNSKGEYFVADSSVGTQYHNKGKNLGGDYNRMEQFLEQKVFDFSLH